MDDSTKTFGQAAGKALTSVLASSEQSTTGSNGSGGDDDHKRYFLQTFRRWAMLFKRKDGDVESDKWLIAEYYKSLQHLSTAGLDKLTDILKENCVFFPTIKECLDATRYDKYDWSHPFRGGGENYLRGPEPRSNRLPESTRQLGYDGD